MCKWKHAVCTSGSVLVHLLTVSVTLSQRISQVFQPQEQIPVSASSDIQHIGTESHTYLLLVSFFHVPGNLHLGHLECTAPQHSSSSTQRNVLCFSGHLSPLFQITIMCVSALFSLLTSSPKSGSTSSGYYICHNRMLVGA